MSEAREREIETAARALVDKLDAVAPHLAGQAVFMHAHGQRYTGPNYADELLALRAALAAGDRPARAGEADAMALLDRALWLTRHAEGCTFIAGPCTCGLSKPNADVRALRAGPAGAGAEAGENTEAAMRHIVIQAAVEAMNQTGDRATQRLLQEMATNIVQRQAAVALALRSAGARPAGDQRAQSPGGQICPTHGKAVLVAHVDDCEPCTDYLRGAAPAPSGRPHTSTEIPTMPEDRSQTGTNVLHNALTRQARDLCHEIEKLPASDQQTRCSLLASDLLRAIYLQTPAGPTP